jgi:hypothetical protein
MNGESDEARAIAHIADAAREVLSASESLEAFVTTSGDGSAPALHLARLTAAVNELQTARDALDEMLTRNSKA